MDDGQLGAIRTALEMQFRYKFYKDTTFPYLLSLGIRDVFQGFGNEDGFIGMLHLWWVPEESNLHYDNPKEFPVKIIGFWKGVWFDTPVEGAAHRIPCFHPLFLPSAASVCTIRHTELPTTK